MTTEHVVITFPFVAETASTAECADRLRRIFNVAGVELTKVARILDGSTTRRDRTRASEELLRAVMLMLHAEPCFVRLEALALPEMVPAWPTPTGGPRAPFHRAWPIAGNHG